MFVSCTFEDIEAALRGAWERGELDTPTQTVDISIKVCCPHCGESDYMENYSTRTAMYYPPIYKDGVNINHDKNRTTTCCTCMNCGNVFSYED